VGGKDPIGADPEAALGLEPPDDAVEIFRGRQRVPEKALSAAFFTASMIAGAVLKSNSAPQ
jgi:hypothetical protein